MGESTEVTGTDETRVNQTDRTFGAEKIGLPPRTFLYTLDQISVMLDVTESLLKREYIYFEGRSIGSRSTQLMWARNIAPVNHVPDWRVAEREYIRWMRCMGFRYYEKGSFSN